MGLSGILYFFARLGRVAPRVAQGPHHILANRHPGSEELIPNTGLVDEVWFDDSKLLRRILSASFDAVIASQATPFRPFVLKLLGIPIRIGHCRPLRARTMVGRLCATPSGASSAP